MYIPDELGLLLLDWNSEARGFPLARFDWPLRLARGFFKTEALEELQGQGFSVWNIFFRCFGAPSVIKAMTDQQD